LNEVQYPTGTDVLEVPWFRKMTTPVPESYVAKASQSQRCNSHAPLHPSLLGLCTSPSLNQSPFKLQCPVSSSVHPRSWFLLKLSNSPALLAEGILRKPFSLHLSMNGLPLLCISPIHQSPDHLPANHDRYALGRLSGHEEPHLASWLAKEFEGLYCLQLPLKMKAIQSFGNVRITHPATWHHIPEEMDLQHHCCENLQFGMMLLVWQHTTHITLLYIGACNWLRMSECTVIHIERLGHSCLWFWKEWLEGDRMLQKRCLIMPVWCTSNLPWPQQMALCASVTNYRPQQPGHSIWIALYSYMDCPMR
jgi:hypothetical protein